MLPAALLFRTSAIAFVVSALVGCTGVPQSATVAVAKPESIVLTQPYTWVDVSSAFGRKLTFEYTMAAGNYTGSREDAGGVFYEGAGNCLVKKVASTNIDGWIVGSTWTQRCGIYVPKTTGSAKVYYYNLGTTTHIPGQPEHLIAGKPSSYDNANTAALNTVATTPGLSPVQAGIGAGLGAAVGGALLEAREEAIRVNAQFLIYQPDQAELRKAFGIH